MNKKILWRMVGVAAVAMVGIQFVPVNRSNPPVEVEFSAPPEVRAVLQRSCYDCHSNETTWPWYSTIAPVSWFVAGHVEEARLELNFSTWNRYDEAQKTKKLKKVGKEVAKGEMPLTSYLLIHRDARLSPADIALLGSLAPAP